MNPAKFSLLCFFCLVKLASAATYPSGFSEKIVAEGITSPTSMVFTPDGRLFVAQQKGSVAVISKDTLLPQPLMTLDADFTTERGLLGLTLDPDFANNHFVYVFYTRPLPTPHNRLSRFTEAGNRVDTSQETVLIDFPPLPKVKLVNAINTPGTTELAVWHFGGSLNFGLDGKLYIGFGENQRPDSAQHATSLLGKVLRVNADGSIPEDGPFYATGNGLTRAIWALGLRNPFSMAIQPVTGRIYANDVGNHGSEEVDLIEKGANYGWSISEGATTDARFHPPLYTYKHTEGCAIMGGDFVRAGAARYAAYRGRYFFADFCNGWIRHVDPVTGAMEPFAVGLQFPTALKFSPQGDLYYVQRGHRTGPIVAGMGKIIKVSDTKAAATKAIARNLEVTGGWLINLGASSPLAVPAGKNGLRIYDHAGRVMHSAEGLRPGTLWRLPAGFPAGSWHYLWTEAGGPGRG